MELRNCILIALAADATPAEIEAAHDVIDRVYGASGNTAIDPKYLVTQTVDATSNGVTAHGQPIGITGTAPTAVVVDDSVDKDGLPWDERIHASSKALTEKGVWRSRRGVDKQLVAKVEAELRGTTSAPADVAPPTDIPAPPAIAAAPPANLPPLPGANVAAVDPAYAAFVELIANNTQSPENPSGRITADWLKQVLAHFGVAEGNLQNLAHNLSLVPQIDTYIRGVL